MTGAEQIEAWRSDFEQWFDTHTNNNHGIAYYVGSGDKYCFTDIELAWQSFLHGKRSQQVIELPQPEDMYDKGDMWLGRFFADGYVHNAITAAGYKYKVKE